MKKLDKENIGYYYERYLPVVTFIIVSIICSLFKINLALCNYMDNILNATITFSSIIVGFVGVLLAVLFSLRQSDIVKELFKYRIKDVLKGYFKRSIISGVSVVGVSTLLFLREIFNYEILKGLTLAGVMTSIWIGLIAYLLVATYILLNIIMHIIFSNPSQENVEMVSDDQVADLQEECSIKEETD